MNTEFRLDVQSQEAIFRIKLDLFLHRGYLSTILLQPGGYWYVQRGAFFAQEGKNGIYVDEQKIMSIIFSV